jgi:hypothetical protein
LIWRHEEQGFKRAQIEFSGPVAGTRKKLQLNWTTTGLLVAVEPWQKSMGQLQLPRLGHWLQLVSTDCSQFQPNYWLGLIKKKLLV